MYSMKLRINQETVYLSHLLVFNLSERQVAPVVPKAPRLENRLSDYKLAASNKSPSVGDGEALQGFQELSAG